MANILQLNKNSREAVMAAIQKWTRIYFKFYFYLPYIFINIV